MTSENVRVRFAPSPTGLLHVGNARTALYNWLFARRMGGKFLLRIEDTDVERSDAQNEQQIFEDLRWLGLNWDEGPEVGGPYAPYRQSERLGIYREATDRLLGEGKAYRCFCTADDLERERQQCIAEHRAPVYSGRCRRLAPEESERRAQAGEPFAVRLRIRDGQIGFHDMVRGEVEFPSEAISDPILVRSSGMPVYNYVVVVDDALMKITHVIRGDDHLSNTPKQVAIYEAFGWTVPEFAHLSTILGHDRERLSKRHGATSVASFREMGILPEALTNYLGLLGWGAEGGKRETFTLEELTQAFTIERVTPSPAVFDWDKLHWLNRHYIKQALPVRIESLAWPYFASRRWLPETNDAAEPEAAKIEDWFQRLLALLIPSVAQLDELPAKASLLWCYDAEAAKSNPENVPLLTSEAGLRVIEAFRLKIMNREGPISAAEFKQIVNEVKLETKAKGPDLYHPIRIVLTGSHSGPEFDKLIPLLEEGSRLRLPTPIPSVRDRVAQYLT